MVFQNILRASLVLVVFLKIIDFGPSSQKFKTRHFEYVQRWLCPKNWGKAWQRHLKNKLSIKIKNKHRNPRIEKYSVIIEMKFTRT